MVEVQVHTAISRNILKTYGEDTIIFLLPTEIKYKQFERNDVTGFWMIIAKELVKEIMAMH